MWTSVGPEMGVGVCQVTSAAVAIEQARPIMAADRTVAFIFWDGLICFRVLGCVYQRTELREIAGYDAMTDMALAFTVVIRCGFEQTLAALFGMFFRFSSAQKIEHEINKYWYWARYASSDNEGTWLFSNVGVSYWRSAVSESFLYKVLRRIILHASIF
jgi:hypothetical protein